MHQSASQIDFTEMPDELRWRIEAEIDRHARHKRDVAKWSALADNGSDEEILVEAGKLFGDDNVPLTLANRYDEVRTWQEVVAFAIPRHPRRPVVMRGSRGACICSHALSHHYGENGWASSIYDRAIKMSKRTILDPEEFREFSEFIRAKLGRKYRLTSAFRDWRIGGASWRKEGADVLIGGRRVWLNQSEFENVSKLHAIIKKSSNLDQRVKAAHAHMRERLAA